MSKRLSKNPASVAFRILFASKIGQNNPEHRQTLSVERGLLWGKITSCLAVLLACLYSYLNLQNELTELKIQVPQLEKEIAAVREETLHLQYQIERGAGPVQLIEIAHRPEFSHLKHPLMKEIVTVAEGIAMQTETNPTVRYW